ncbi:MAG: type III polyketide synthase [Chitinophagaceae bacterium]|nr:type III polyketide synthase [Chitinophagaceae bacterium]
MTDIISIATAVPQFCHLQEDILLYMSHAFQLDDTEKRKLKFMYHQSGIKQRFSVLPDFSEKSAENFFASRDGRKIERSLEHRLKIYDESSVHLSIKAIQQCISGLISEKEITHLITVSCTGMTAPGLDIKLVEELKLNKNIFRTSVNFMGCYAAIHALKLADMIAQGTPNANIIIVAVELCTLHFQTTANEDNIGSSLLFADGCAAVLLSNNIHREQKIRIDGFYSQIAIEGKSDMAWELGSKGFQMKLSGYIPQLIEADIESLLSGALEERGMTKESIHHWCIHPGGKRILDSIQRKLNLSSDSLMQSRTVLNEYGNMSSPTILFVLKRFFENNYRSNENILGMAFGPGLTMETFTAHFV